MNWFLTDRDTLPDMAIALAAVMPIGSTLNAALDGYLRPVQDYCDERVCRDNGGSGLGLTCRA